MSLKDVGYTHQCSQYSPYRGFNCMLFLSFISVAYTWKSSAQVWKTVFFESSAGTQKRKKLCPGDLDQISCMDLLQIK